MRLTTIQPEFVEMMPPELAPGTLYVSMEYATTVHLCACGCGNKVVLPLSPAEWRLKFDGEAISLTPSIGNWQFPCRSHYWIRNNRIDWAPAWTQAQVETGRRRDAADLAQYFDQRQDEARIAAGQSDDDGRRKPVRRRRRWLMPFRDKK